ncbi:hypothetical protein JG688_00003818 [Phytophthora aleatoria]|uniref:DUF7769 domain-containing protein n=1 Tax=Phytophthora aleatoria TaxID=2496075 RepID=A0A8J5MHF1_9STRA|nr:hypothetical protein JG688_00003818 [Phytophthora aleatoria]
MAKPNTVRKTKLTDAKRQRVLMALLLRSTNGDLKRGDLSAVAAAEGIHPSTISRLWARAKQHAVGTLRPPTDAHKRPDPQLAIEKLLSGGVETGPARGSQEHHTRNVALAA